MLTPSYKKILVTGVASIGDAVMSLPAVAAIRRAFPSAEIEMLSFSLTAPLYRRSGNVNSVAVLRDGGSLSILKALRRRKKKYDAVLLLAGGFVWALGARLAGIPVRAGLDADKRGFLLTGKVRLDAEGLHQVESYLQVASLLTETEEAARAPTLLLEDVDRNDADRLLADSGLVKKPFFIINPAASTPYKMWPLDRFAAVAEGVMAESGMSCLLLGSPADRRLCEDLSKRINSGHVVDLSGQSSLPVTAALLARAVFYMGNNSGIMHIAAAVGKHVLCLSGPSNVRKTRPWGEQHIILSGNSGATVREKAVGLQKVHPTLLAVSVEEALIALKEADFFQW